MSDADKDKYRKIAEEDIEEENSGEEEDLSPSSRRKLFMKVARRHQADVRFLKVLYGFIFIILL